MQVGTQPRSVAVVLLKWRREYYKSKEQCCQEQNNVEGCDCKWGSRTWDNLPPPKTYSRLFTDECDKGPSLNRVSAGAASAAALLLLHVCSPQGVGTAAAAACLLIAMCLHSCCCYCCCIVFVQCSTLLSSS
jgi:hypothetical protein